jgi:hypothetical protein
MDASSRLPQGIGPAENLVSDFCIHGCEKVSVILKQQNL